MSSIKVWSEGERCQVRWPEDGELYSARIRKIQKEGGRVTAMVIFDEFASDEEEYDISELRRLEEAPATSASKKRVKGQSSGHHGNCSIIKPLLTEEEEFRLEQKYGSLSDSDECIATPTVSPVKTWGKVSQWQMSHDSSRGGSQHQKGIVASGGSPKTRKNSANISRKQSQQQHRDARKTKEDPAIATETNMPQQVPRLTGTGPSSARTSALGNQFTGFTEDDMEKPKFTFTPTAAKTPFPLSAEGISPAVQIPAVMNQYLRDYQREGARFMYSHYEKGRGAILGDDMGLGKTVQVIAFLAALLNKQGNRIDIMKQKPKFIRRMSESVAVKEDGPAKVFLIIGPGSVLYNWLDELDTWGHFAVGKYHGAGKESCLVDVRRGKVEIVVTTFETCRDNIETLNCIDWDAVIVDEVHRIKGLQARTTKALRSLSTHRRFGLTGTALQNLMTELWCILDWAQPGALGDLPHFMQDYVQVIEQGQRHDATKRELADARKQKEKFASIRKEILLRRTKSLIADQLPKKDDNVVLCRMAELQVSVYRAILQQPGLQLVLGMEEPCSCHSGRLRAKCCGKKLPDGSGVRGLMFTFMHLLLKAANHIALLVPDRRSSQSQSEMARAVCHAVFQQHPQFVCQTQQASFRTLSDPKYCGKMKILQGLLSVFHKNHSKVLIFSYSTRLLDILEQYVIGTGYEYRRLDGSVSAKRRMQFVREFNRDPNIFVFLISTKAGGLGLNLIGADRVIIFDPNWNPSHDLQAQDRAYRIGQRKNVQVFRLISAGTIEENVYLRQVYKQQLDCVAVSTLNAKRLFHGIQGDRHHRGELFGVKNMFQLRTGDSCLTVDVLERNSKVEKCLAKFDIAPYVPSSYELQQQEEEAEKDAEDSSEAEMDESADSEFSVFREMLGNGPDDDIDCQSINFLCSEVLGEQEEVEGGRSGRRQREASDCSNGESVPGSKARASPAASSGRKKSGAAGSKSSFDSVADVFDQCGVVHVHENRRITGGSRAEDHMTRCALQDVYELHQNSQVPADVCPPYSQSSEEEEEMEPTRVRGRAKKSSPDDNAPRSLLVGGCKVLLGQTPTAFCRKQFGELAALQGQSPVAMAEWVVQASQPDRVAMLLELYQHCHPDLHLQLQSLFSRPPTPPPSHPTPAKGKSTRTMQAQRMPTKPWRKHPACLTSLHKSDSDSQSQDGRTAVEGGSGTDHSSLDIGAKPSPLKTHRAVKALTTSSRSAARKRTPGTGGGKVRDGASLWQTLTALPDDISFSESSGNYRSDHRDVKFLSEIACSDSSLTKIKPKPLADARSHADENPSTLFFDAEDREESSGNILDDIFFSDTRNRRTKESPPRKIRKQSKEATTSSPAKSTAIAVRGRPSTSRATVISGCTSVSSDLPDSSVLDFLTSSTLKEEGVDCFASTPAKKSRPSPKPSPAKTMEALVRKGEEDYQKLFRTGKLSHQPSRERRSKKDITESEADLYDLSAFVEKSPSLFS